MEWMEPTEVVEVRLSFLATRGEPPGLDGMVTSGGAAEEEMGGLVAFKFLGVERQMDRTLSP